MKNGELELIIDGLAVGVDYVECYDPIREALSILTDKVSDPDSEKVHCSFESVTYALAISLNLVIESGVVVKFELTVQVDEDLEEDGVPFSITHFEKELRAALDDAIQKYQASIRAYCPAGDRFEIKVTDCLLDDLEFDHYSFKGRSIIPSAMRKEYFDNERFDAKLCFQAIDPPP